MRIAEARRLGEGLALVRPLCSKRPVASISYSIKYNMQRLTI